MNKEYTELNPITGTIYTPALDSLTGKLADLTNKRRGGGRVQFGLMSYNDIANAIVKLPKGYDKRHRGEYDSRIYVLSRFFDEHQLPIFDKAIVIALVRKHFQDPGRDASDVGRGFIPLGPGSVDIEAGLNPEGQQGHLELMIKGIQGQPYSALSELCRQTLGIATEYGNENSLEIVIPTYTPGQWREIIDLEHGRRTGMAIVVPPQVVWVEGMDINNAQLNIPNPSVKTLEAVKLGMHFSKELELG